MSEDQTTINKILSEYWAKVISKVVWEYYLRILARVSIIRELYGQY